MTTAARIQKHKECKKILKKLSAAESELEEANKNYLSEHMIYLWGKDELNQDIELAKAAIVRLEERYQRVMNELNVNN